MWIQICGKHPYAVFRSEDKSKDRVKGKISIILSSLTGVFNPVQYFVLGDRIQSIQFFYIKPNVAQIRYAYSVFTCKSLVSRDILSEQLFYCNLPLFLRFNSLIMRLYIRPQAAVNLAFRLMLTFHFLKCAFTSQRSILTKSKYSLISSLK